VTEPIEQPSQSAVLSLIESYVPPGETFAIALSKGDILQFRNETSFSKLRQIQKAASQWVTIFRGACQTHEAFAPFKELAGDAETLQYVYILAELSAEPKFSQIDMLTIAMKAGVLFSEIKQRVDLASMNLYVTGFNDEIEKAKKKSKQGEQPGEQGSKSVEMSGENTPTN